MDLEFGPPIWKLASEVCTTTSVLEMSISHTLRLNQLISSGPLGHARPFGAPTFLSAGERQ